MGGGEVAECEVRTKNPCQGPAPAPLYTLSVSSSCRGCATSSLRVSLSAGGNPPKKAILGLGQSCFLSGNVLSFCSERFFVLVRWICGTPGGEGPGGLFLFGLDVGLG